MAKLTKEQVDYSRGMQNTHCGPVFLKDQGYCDHYRSPHPDARIGSCEIVEGNINPLYWCRRFKKFEK